MSMLRTLACLPFMCLLAATAHADVPPPDTWGCRNMNEGAACDMDVPPGADAGAAKRGTCQKNTCSRVDYANWNRDASASPPIMQYECLKCAAPADAGTADGPAPTADGPAATADRPAPASDVAVVGGADAAPVVSADAAGSVPPATKDDSGCALGGPSDRRQWGPWLLAGGVSALMFFARRRRR